MARVLLFAVARMCDRIGVLSGWLVIATALACGSASSTEGTPALLEAPKAVRVANDRVEVPAGALAFVRTERATSATTSSIVEAPAHVAFRDGAVARVGAPVEGRVQAVHVRPGDHVEVGTPLLTLGSPNAASARAELKRATAVLRASRLELERQAALVERGVGIARDHVEAEAGVAEAEAELARAKHANALLGRDRGTVVVVRAPIAGVVLTRAVTIGATVDPAGDPLLELGDPTAVWVIAEVFDHEVDRISEGAPATIEISGASAPLRAVVLSVGSAVDPHSRRAPVWLSLEDAAPGLRAGSYVRADIEAGDPAPALVPTSAVVLREGLNALVYVATDERGVFERRAVAIGRPFRGRTPVMRGLAPDEEIVVDGVLLLDAAAEQLL